MSISITYYFLLEFNLPPIHLCDGIISDVLDMWKQNFMYTRDVSGSLVTHFNHLRDIDNGAAIRTYRENEEAKSRFPNKMWF